MTLENGKFGQLNDDDPYYGSKIIDIVASSLKNADIDPAHVDMVETSIAETLTHLAVENTRARDLLLETSTDNISEQITDALERLRCDTASVHDKLRILGSGICPQIHSLELARCHHFLENNIAEEEEMAWLVGEGMGIYGIETPTRSPRLHKIRIHTSYRDGETGLITGAIISIKETISSTDRVGVRHRLKSYINVPDLESGMEHRTGYGGSVDEQRLQLQRLLARGLKNKEPYQQQMGGLEMFCVPVGSPSANNVMRYMGRHPEHLLTSIYYGFRPQDVTHEPTSLEDGKTPIGGTALFAARM